MCKFDIAWVGTCKKEPGKKMCAEHENLKCACCGEPATRECPETFGFVCGVHICDTCEHYRTDEGTNFRGGKHCKPEDNNPPWYMMNEKK